MFAENAEYYLVIGIGAVTAALVFVFALLEKYVRNRQQILDEKNQELSDRCKELDARCDNSKRLHDECEADRQSIRADLAALRRDIDTRKGGGKSG